MIEEAWKLYSEVEYYNGRYTKNFDNKLAYKFKTTYSDKLVAILKEELPKTKANTMLGVLKELSPAGKKAAVILASVSRSTLFKTKSEYACSLIPIVADILKDERGIDYEHWLKEPNPLEELGGCPKLAYFFGPALMEVFDDREKQPPLITKELVEEFLSSSKGAILPDGYPVRGSVKTEERFSKLSSIILTKTWYAHPSRRSNRMVLDIWDWDKPGKGDCLVSSRVAPILSSEDELPF